MEFFMGLEAQFKNILLNIMISRVETNQIKHEGIPLLSLRVNHGSKV